MEGFMNRVIRIVTIVLLIFTGLNICSSQMWHLRRNESKTFPYEVIQGMFRDGFSVQQMGN
jgi:hypothetical protein